MPASAHLPLGLQLSNLPGLFDCSSGGRLEWQLTQNEPFEEHAQAENVCSWGGGSLAMRQRQLQNGQYRL